MREYLEVLDGWEGSEPVPKNISLTDPMASWTAAPGGPAFYAYSTNYLIDVEHGVILDVEATPAHRTTEVGATKTMIERVEDTFELVPRRLIGDMAYGSASMLGWMVGKSTEPHAPVWDKTQRTNNTLSSTDFQWDERNNEYRCPQGHALRSRRRSFKKLLTHITKANTVLYRSSQKDCVSCPIKAQCRPNTPMRKIARSVHEAARDVARQIATTLPYRQSRRDRKKVEVLFAHLKPILRLDRLRLPGLTGAHDEFTLAAAVQNLRRLAKLVPEQPPPAPTSVCA